MAKAAPSALKCCALAVFGSIFIHAPILAQTAYADHAAIDRAVEAFTQMPIGAPGGARAPVDRRFRLAACQAPFALRLYGNRGDSVQVECPDAGGWRIYVPLVANTAPTPTIATPHKEVAAENIIMRGERISITVEGDGFSVTQSGEALEAGPLGAWIKVQPPGKSDAVRARIESPGRVTIPLN